MAERTPLVLYRNSDVKVTYSLPAGYNLDGFAPAFYFRTAEGEAATLTVGPSPTPNGSSVVVAGNAVVLIVKAADSASFPAGDIFNGVYDSSLTKTGFVNRFVGGPMTVYVDGSYGEGVFSESVFITLSGIDVPVFVEGGNLSAAAATDMQAINQAVADASESAAVASAAAVTAVAATANKLDLDGDNVGGNAATLLQNIGAASSAALALSSGASLISAIKDSTGAVVRSVQDILRDRVSIKDFGAIGDGNSHPLSGVFANLAAAQAVYPFVTSLSQELDYAAIQAALNTRKEVFVPRGDYRSTTDITLPFGVTNGAASIFGCGKTSSIITFSGSGVTKGFSGTNPVAGTWEYCGAIRDLKIKGISGAQRGSHFEYLSQPEVTGVHYQGFPNAGCVFIETINARISKALFTGCGSASYGQLEIDGGTTAIVDQVYASGGGSGCRASYRVDRHFHFMMYGGAGESGGVGLEITSKAESSVGCVQGVVIGTDFENCSPMYIDGGQGWSGTTGLGVREWLFVNVNGSLSGATNVTHGARMRHSSGVEFSKCTWDTVGGGQVASHEFVGNTNQSPIVQACRTSYNAGGIPWVMVNSVMQASATPQADWSMAGGSTNVGTGSIITAVSATELRFSTTQGGMDKVSFISAPSPVTVNTLTSAGVAFGTTVTLIANTNNVTLKNLSGSVGQMQLAGNVDRLLMSGQAVTLVYNSSGQRWVEVGTRTTDTGWTAATGTGSKGAFAAAAAGTASAAYVQAELQTALNRIAALEARLKAYDDVFFAQGQISA